MVPLTAFCLCSTLLRLTRSLSCLSGKHLSVSKPHWRNCSESITEHFLCAGSLRTVENVKWWLENHPSVFQELHTCFFLFPAMGFWLNLNPFFKLKMYLFVCMYLCIYVSSHTSSHMCVSVCILVHACIEEIKGHEVPQSWSYRHMWLLESSPHNWAPS